MSNQKEIDEFEIIPTGISYSFKKGGDSWKVDYGMPFDRIKGFIPFEEIKNIKKTIKGPFDTKTITISLKTLNKPYFSHTGIDTFNLSNHHAPDRIELTLPRNVKYKDVFEKILKTMVFFFDEYITHNIKNIREMPNYINKAIKEEKYISLSGKNNIFLINKILSNNFFDPFGLKKLTHIHSIIFDKFKTTIRHNSKAQLDQHNNNCINNSLNINKQLFSNIEKFPLNDEQKLAVVTNEDRHLLIAAAGSGKSSTIVAKAIHLIANKLAKPEDILVLVYNKDAQIEINERLTKAVGITPLYQNPVLSKTFHGLALDIIVQTERIKPSITEYATSSKKRLGYIFSELIKSIKLSDKKFKRKWSEFLTTYKNPLPNYDTITSIDEYNEYLEELGAKYKNFNGRRQLLLPTYSGLEVKSLEEVRICNWLTLNNVEFEYERPYEKDTTDKYHRQYYPDFYYPEANLYHEHFALNKLGHAPSFMKDYKSGVEWKRKTHYKNNTKLVETHSADIRDGTIFTKLESYLIKNNIKMRPISDKELDEVINNAFNPDNDTQLINTFLKHYKANNSSMDVLNNKVQSSPDISRSQIFIEIFETIYNKYESILSENCEIDFEDLINNACELIETGKYQSQFKYILVDEFQDVSQDRKRLIELLLAQNSSSKLFSVGDDWQSIYRFSGADINIITNFSSYFGASKIDKLTKTYRSYNGIVDIASEFVQKNHDQLKKEIKAHINNQHEQVFIRGYLTNTEHDNQIKGILAAIHKKSLEHSKKLSVFLLARYNRFLPKHIESYTTKFPNLNIQFKTIHTSKGLEADYVIVLNIKSGRLGFPSMISDDPMLHFVIPYPEKFPYAEERRLMYVALTRAKRAVFLLSDNVRQSNFIRELSYYDNINIKGFKNRNNPCPNCLNGDLELKKGKNGIFLGCDKFPKCKYSTSSKKKMNKFIHNDKYRGGVRFRQPNFK
jgi:DNA helicase-4